MRTATEIHHKTRIRNTYSLDAVSNKKEALQKAVDMNTCILLENKLIRCEDGRSFHDGSESFVCNEIENANDFIDRCLNSAIYVVMISGDFKGKHVSVQMHLNLQQIYVCADKADITLIEEIEQLLELV